MINVLTKQKKIKQKVSTWGGGRGVVVQALLKTFTVNLSLFDLSWHFDL